MGWLSTVWLSVSQALSGPPATDAARLERVETMIKEFPAPIREAPTVTPEQLTVWLASGEPVVLVDVRGEEERKVSVLPGAITPEAFEGADHTGKKVVVYCTIGYRSGKWVADHPGTDVFNLRGSLLAWTHMGGALVDPAGVPTKKVHTYGPSWNLVANGYEAVW